VWSSHFSCAQRDPCGRFLFHQMQQHLFEILCCFVLSFEVFLLSLDHSVPGFQVRDSKDHKFLVTFPDAVSHALAISHPFPPEAQWEGCLLQRRVGPACHGSSHVPRCVVVTLSVTFMPCGRKISRSSVTFQAPGGCPEASLDP